MKRLLLFFLILPLLLTATPQHDIVSWERDERGLVIKQVENNQRTTFYDYDGHGRLIRATLPSHIVLTNTYDDTGHLLVIKSSDGTVWQEYVYNDLGLTKMIDHVEGHTWESVYNAFGQMTYEKTPLFSLSWDYDACGRKTCLHLPDSSAIRYSYEGAHMKCVERLSPTGDQLYQHQYTLFDHNGHVKSEELILALGSVETGRDHLKRASYQNSPYHSHKLSYGPSGLVMEIQNTLCGNKSCSYDDLGQLIREGSRTYQFDSFGDSTILFDADGNPLNGFINGQKVHYRYDALSRLQEIIYPHARHVRYGYDPLSRLFSKTIYTYQKSQWVQTDKQFYIYDHEKEIGTLDEKLHIKELKVVGLGIKGDIGAAVAIELNGKPYAPLHDFMGNIIGLINSKGALVESYDISAFGEEELKSPSLNPWRFASKRSEEGLVFFGMRFYDPSLHHWLTPDPAGYIDGANLYAYVGNNPLNRLDYFGLYQESLSSESIFDIPLADIPREPGIARISGIAHIAGYTVDMLAKCGHWHLLNFTDEEIASGSLNFFDHIHELYPVTGSQMGLSYVGNGALTDYVDFDRMFNTLSAHTGGALCLAVHNRSEGWFWDAVRLFGEKFFHMDTPIIRVTSQIVKTVSEQLFSINRDAAWLYIAHSEGGLILKRSIESLPFETRQIVQQNLYIYAAAPPENFPMTGYAAGAKNVYSRHDYVTGWFATSYANCPNPKIPNVHVEWLKPLSGPQEDDWFAEHRFLTPTLRDAWETEIGNHIEGRGFYGYSLYANQTR